MFCCSFVVNRSLLGVRLTVVSFVLAWQSFQAGFAGSTIDKATVQALIEMACRDEPQGQVTTLLDRAPSTVEEPLQARGNRYGWRRTVELAEQQRILLDRIAPRGLFRGARLEHWIGSKPELFVAAGPDCKLHTARQINYDESGRAIELLHLDQDFATVRAEMFNPPLPRVHGTNGTRVGMVDSGINYTLDIFGPHLAVRTDGELVGYDYWDLDSLPFDSNPARSPFFPQRHGTRTASLLIKEATSAALVPYRYPRPDMGRMRELVRHAAEHDVRIIGMPLGSHKQEDWAAFAQAADAHPDILFIVSAGNQGRDIDQNPVYPASLPLTNMLVVTSADDYGRPAEGSNWGAISVDLLIPAERMLVTNFEGQSTVVSGSSYAVSRTAALAVRLKEKHPEWSGHELISEIAGMAFKGNDHSETKFGFLADPLSDTARVALVGRQPLKFEIDEGEDTRAYNLYLDIVLLRGSKWTVSAAQNMIKNAAQILSQCHINLTDPTLHIVDVSEYLLDFYAGNARTLVENLTVSAPTVYLVRSSTMEFPFDGEAFGRANSVTRPWLTDSVWLVADTEDPDIALAHELFHVLTNQGDHSGESLNLMQARTNADNRDLTHEQCMQARKTGIAHGLLHRR